MKCPKCQHENPGVSTFCGKCGTQLIPQPEAQPSFTKTLETSQEELATGSIFAGRYQVIEELGKGGMGKVYRVLDKKLNEEVALKLIKPEIASDKKTLERFKNELKLARKVVQKNVGRMFDIGEETGTHYITMEYVPGEDLKSFIRRIGQMPVGKTIVIAKQLCEGLSEAHSIGIVHRDLKPSNIMIDKNGNARIMDFGIARSLKGKGITGAGVIIGTPEYMSPEQVDGKDADQRSDIYSLGIILYEMLTGRLPFEGETPLSIAVQHRSDTPKDAKEFNAQIPDDLDRIILKCLGKKPEDRFQATTEILSELIKIEQGLPTTDRTALKRKPTTSKQITVSLMPRKIIILALVAFSSVIIGLILWHPWSKSDTSTRRMDKPSVAVLPFEDFSPQKDQAHRCYGIPTDLINRLNKIQDLLWVPARASSFSFGGEDFDIKEVGEKLGVKSVLLGTLQKEEDELRISVELVDVADNATIWQHEYLYEEGNILDLIDEISFAILNKLKIGLLDEERTDFMRRYTENKDAYDLYLKGQYFIGRRNEKDIKDSIDYFEKAIEIDPNYALAYSGLAYAYVLLPEYSDVPIDEIRHKVIEASQRAQKLDPMNAELYQTLAFLYRISWEWNKAEISIKKAIELNPNYADAYNGYAFCLLQLARYDEAIENINIALKLDPLSLIINQNVGELYYYSRQYDKSIDASRRTIEMEPGFPQAHYFLGRAYLAMGKYEEAMEEFRLEKILPKPYDPYYVDSVIGATYIKQGMVEEATKIFSRIKRESLQKNVPPIALAILCFALGKNGEGFAILETACSVKDARLAYINVDPLFDSVRTDPRFITLLNKMGLN